MAGKRKSPIMLLSWGPVLGRGTSKSILEPAEKQRESQRLNMSPDMHIRLSFDFARAV